MDGNFNIIVSDRAERMLELHIRFLAKVSESGAESVRANIIEALDSLQKFPARYPFFEEDYIPKNKYHKMFVNPYFLVLYQIQDNNILVDYILDCRSDYQWLL